MGRQIIMEMDAIITSVVVSKQLAVSSKQLIYLFDNQLNKNDRSQILQVSSQNERRHETTREFI